MDVLVAYLNMSEARGEVKVGVKVSVLQVVEGVIHMRKWACVFTRNLIKATVVNAHAKRSIGCITHEKNWRAKVIVARTNYTRLYCVFELSVRLKALRMWQYIKTMTFDRANCFGRLIPLSTFGGESTGCNNSGKAS
jgi:hypothetical protein